MKEEQESEGVAPFFCVGKLVPTVECESSSPVVVNTSFNVVDSSIQPPAPSALLPGYAEISSSALERILCKVDSRLRMLEQQVMELQCKNSSLEEQVSGLLEYSSSVHEKLLCLEKQVTSVESTPHLPSVVTPERESSYSPFSASSSSSDSRSLLFSSPERGGVDFPCIGTGIGTVIGTGTSTGTSIGTSIGTSTGTTATTTAIITSGPKIVYSAADLQKIRSVYVDGPVSKRRIPPPLLVDALKTRDSFKNIQHVQPPLHNKPSPSSSPSSASSSRNTTPVRKEGAKAVTRDAPSAALQPPPPPLSLSVRPPLITPPRTLTVEQVGEFTVSISQ